MKKVILPFVFVLLLLPLLMAQKATVQSAKGVSIDFASDNMYELVITGPKELAEKTRGFARVQGATMQITGTLTDKDKIKSLYVNNNYVSINPTSGAFIATVNLTSGLNEVAFKITDGLDNVYEKTYQVNNDPVTASDQQLTADLGAPVGKYYALIIGVEQYQDPQIVDLDNPIKDARMVKKVLTEQYTFAEEDVDFIENASRAQIIDALDNLAKKVKDNDNVLIFYAGHGYWDAEAELGYWIPSDGRKTSTADWFRNSTLTDQISAIKSKHTLLIADACFSGGIFKTRAAFMDASLAINKKYSVRSRKAMTSGTLTEVPDRSAFIKFLVNRLESNSQKYLSASSLFYSFEEAVINNSDVRPQYGTIQKVGDEGGDFIFIRKQ